MNKVLRIIKQEKKRQKQNVELIASENFVSKKIMKVTGSCLTNKYTEGYPNKRYYGGCENYDKLELYCQEKWKEVFKTNYHVNVQPHSGSNANMAVYNALLQPGDTILSMSLDSGGHLTHGSPANFSGKLYNIINYELDSDGLILYSNIKDLIKKHKPKLIIAGASAYSRTIDFKKIYHIIQSEKNDSYSPYFMVDMSHIAGLVACGEHPSPFGYADVITTTTHKTLRGPRGGLIFCLSSLSKKIDSAVFPGTQGGSLMHVIAGKAVAAEECQTRKYKRYIHQVVKNSKAMAKEFERLGCKIVTHGTDNHMFLIDVSDKYDISGQEAQNVLDSFGITVNKNCVPGDKRSVTETSGIRIGTPAMTTKGWKEKDFINCAKRINMILSWYVKTKQLTALTEQISDLAQKI